MSSRPTRNWSLGGMGWARAMQGTYVMGNIEIGATRGILAVGKIIGKTVVQPSHAELRTGMDGLGQGDAGQDGGQKEKEPSHMLVLLKVAADADHGYVPPAAGQVLWNGSEEEKTL